MSKSATVVVCLVVCLLGGLMLLIFWPDGEDGLGPTIPELRPQVAKLVKPPRPPVDYVGSQKCAACHEEIYQKYQSHPMAHSAAMLKDAPIQEDYVDKTSFEMPDGRMYRVERKGDEVFHHESMKDAEGKLIYDISVPVALEIGSGKRGRSYGIARDQLLFMSPVTWYTEGSRWDMSPGYSVQNNPRFTRRIMDACIVCHVGQLNRDSDAIDLFHRPAILEGPISCERCHGPGGRHVQRHEASEGARIAESIVNPASLDPERREAVCYQCHLQGVRRLLRYGRTEYDFRPGQPLSDTWAVFVKGSRVSADGSTEAVSHVEQTRSSKCFTASDGAFGCTSCHDPHGSPNEQEKAAFFQNSCLKCHSDSSPCSLPPVEQAAAPANGSCVHCHMPKLAANDVPHTSQTDHRILRRPQSISTAVEAKVTSRLFANAEEEIPKIEQDRARGILMLKTAQKDKDQVLASDALDLLLPIAEANPTDLEVLEAVGVAYWIHGHLDQAELYWDRILQVDPTRERTLENLATICHDAHSPKAGVEYLEMLFKVNRWRPDLYGRQTHMYGQLGDFEKGIPAAKRGLELDPSVAALHGWLSEAYEVTGDDEQSKYHRDMHRRIFENRPDQR